MVERRLEFERLDTRELCATVGVGTDAEQITEDRWSVPVTIDDSTGVRAAEVRLRYDSEAWAVEPSSIKAGSAWVQGGATMAKVDPDAGEITVFVFATQELTGDKGDLLHVELKPHDTANTTPAPLEVQSVRLNEGAIAADVSDDGEDDYINPRIRARHNLQPTRVIASEVTSPTTDTTASTTFNFAPVHDQPYGPQPLFKRFRPIPDPLRKQAVPRIEVNADESAEASSDNRSTSIIDPRLWLLADDQARLRRRAS